MDTTSASVDAAGIPMQRGPLPSIWPATSSVSPSSLTTLKSQGYLAVPIKGSGVNSSAGTSYYLVDLAHASIETLETMDRDKNAEICLEDETCLKRIFTDWLLDDDMKVKYHFVGLQTKWISF